MQLRPGHSPSDTRLLGRPSGKILIAADHLIAHISSNPLISRPLDGSSERPPGAGRATSSRSQKTRELPAEIVLSGHGEPITNHVELIDERFAMHQRRAEKLYGLIAEEPRDAVTSSPRRCGATSR